MDMLLTITVILNRAENPFQKMTRKKYLNWRSEMALNEALDVMKMYFPVAMKMGTKRH